MKSFCNHTIITLASAYHHKMKKGIRLCQYVSVCVRVCERERERVISLIEAKLPILCTISGVTLWKQNHEEDQHYEFFRLMNMLL
jgi:hypothetical protein